MSNQKFPAPTFAAEPTFLKHVDGVDVWKCGSVYTCVNGWFGEETKSVWHTACHNAHLSRFRQQIAEGEE